MILEIGDVVEVFHRTIEDADDPVDSTIVIQILEGDATCVELNGVSGGCELLTRSPWAGYRACAQKCHTLHGSH